MLSQFFKKFRFVLIFGLIVISTGDVRTSGIRHEETIHHEKQTENKNIGSSDTMTCSQNLHPVSYENVNIIGGFWGVKQHTNTTLTIPAIYEQCKKTGRIDAWKLEWTPDSGKPKPHIFWDSDVAKWIEAASYSLSTHPDKELENKIDTIIDMMATAQRSDGYLNTYFINIEPENRWANLRDWHELYCAGHLIEAAVAYYQVTGKRKLLDIIRKYTDYIDTVFGRVEGQKRGYPGHEEIELALVKLYRLTNEKRYLQLSKYFIDERGQQPYYFDIEAKARGDDPGDYWAGTHAYNQAHIPVRKQREPVGHAVRATYLYSAMADLAAEYDVQELLKACRHIWDHLTRKNMYITGGIGSTGAIEGFGPDYYLPNKDAYAETCAAIGLIFWAHRLLQIEKDSQYSDIMERALYNGALSGVSLVGNTFFYRNPLASEGDHHRWEWHHCSCCPPNIARLIASLGQYIYSANEDEIYTHLYVNGEATIDFGENSIKLSQTTRYPWDENVIITVEPTSQSTFTLAVRVPGWCDNPSLIVNDQNMNISQSLQKGYVHIRRIWKAGDQVRLHLPMLIERVRAHPNVEMDLGRVALQRGPIVYCLEEVDNGDHLTRLALPHDTKLQSNFEPDLLGGVVTITGQAKRIVTDDWDNTLYHTDPVKNQTVPFKAIPYYTWNNREPGEMLVWIREK